MAYEQKDNTFSIFTNDNKSKESQPDYTGQGKLHGEDIKVEGWKKVAKTGKEYISFKVEKKDENLPF